MVDLRLLHAVVTTNIAAAPMTKSHNEGDEPFESTGAVCAALASSESMDSTVVFVTVPVPPD